MVDVPSPAAASASIFGAQPLDAATGDSPTCTVRYEDSASTDTSLTRAAPGPRTDSSTVISQRESPHSARPSAQVNPEAAITPWSAGMALVGGWHFENEPVTLHPARNTTVTSHACRGRNNDRRHGCFRRMRPGAKYTEHRVNMVNGGRACKIAGHWDSKSRGPRRTPMDTDFPKAVAASVGVRLRQLDYHNDSSSESSSA